MWAHHVLERRASATERVPILIELRGTSPRNLSPLQFLGAWSAQYNLNPQALMRLLVAGRLVIVFEGFDEMALVGDAEMRLKHFKTLWQFTVDKAKLLITGRPNFFLDEQELNAALGIGRPTGNPYSEAVRLAPFDLSQIRAALRAYKPEVGEQIEALAARSSRFFDLVSRPSLLHVVAVLWEREDLFGKVDQLTSAFVLELFVRYSYRRQGLKERDSPDFMALTSPEREYFMRGIATFMAARHLPNQISGAQLNEIVAGLVESIPDSVSSEAAALSGETRMPLRRRVNDSKHGLESVRTDVRACGLLVDDPAAPGTFRFGHKSFMEYLFAAVIAERISAPDGPKARSILSATGASIEDVLYLPTAVDFLAELLGGSGAGRGGEGHEAVARKLFDSIMRLGAVRSRLMRLGISFVVLVSWLLSKLVPSLATRKDLAFSSCCCLFLSVLCLPSLYCLSFHAVGW